MNQDEYGRLPEEHPKPADEFVPLPPESADRAPIFQEAPRKRRFFQIAAAALVLGGIMLSDPVKLPQPAPEPVILAQPPAVETEPAATEMTQPALPDKETEPPATEAIQPETQTAAEPPQCKVIFFSFSDTLKAKLIFPEPELIQSVTAELWDSLGQTMEQSWEVPREDILAGSYLLPDMMGEFDMFIAHHAFEELSDYFPVPELRVTMTYTDGTQEKTTDLQQPVSEELGWSARARNGMISFRTYEWETRSPIRVAGENPQNLLHTLSDGEILITVEMNGRFVPESDCNVTYEEEIFKNSAGVDVPYYYSGVTIPYGEDNGTAVVTVYQKLLGYDSVWIESTEVSYPAEALAEDFLNMLDP